MHGKFQKLYRSEKLNGRENNIQILVRNTMEEMSSDDWT
jgi:hypothetical protein